MYKYDGSLLERVKLYETELYAVEWRPCKKGVFDAFEASPKSSSKKLPTKVIPEESKKPSLSKMFASDKFAALMEKEMGGKISSEPHWLKGD